MDDAAKGEASTGAIGIQTLNSISPVGLKRLPAERYAVGNAVSQPRAILVRSQDMHGMDIPPTVRAIGRAGAGTNNIPVAEMSRRGVPVFGAPVRPVTKVRLSNARIRDFFFVVFELLDIQRRRVARSVADHRDGIGGNLGRIIQVERAHIRAGGGLGGAREPLGGEILRVESVVRLPLVRRTPMQFCERV